MTSCLCSNVVTRDFLQYRKSNLHCVAFINSTGNFIAIVAGLDLSGLGYFSEAGPSTPPASPPASSPPANEPISDQKTLTNGSSTGSRDTSANSDMGAIIGGIVGGIIGVVLLAGCLRGHPCLRKKY